MNNGEQKRRIPLDKKFMTKKINDVLYGYLQVKSTLNVETNMRYIKNRIFLMNIFMPISKRFKKLMSAMLYTKRIYLEETIKAINEKYGSVLEFMYQRLDITPQKQEKIKKLYLE